MPNNEPVYVAFDSDLMSEFAIIYNDEKIGKITDFSNMSSDPLLRKYGGYIRNIYYLIKTDQIRPIVLNTVYNECMLVKFIEAFILKYGYFPDYNLKNKTQKRDEAKRLARLYCEEYEHKGVKHFAPMKIEYNAHDDSMRPQNDAYAMAEATIENCIFVTANEKDFISAKKEDMNNSRALGILNINLQQGYYTETSTGRTIIPKPMSIRIFGPLAKTISEFEYAEPNKLIKASDIM